MPLPERFEETQFELVMSEELSESLGGLVKTMLPLASFGPGGRRLFAEAVWNGMGLETRVALEGAKTRWYHLDLEIASSGYQSEDRRKRAKERTALGVRHVLTETYGLTPSPWGILRGVRPTKMLHNLWDRGYTTEKIRWFLTDVYGLHASRRELLLDIGERQRAFFPAKPNSQVSLYVGIPFCPTRCGYCSFAGYPLATHGHLLQPFLTALKREIHAVGRVLNEQAIPVDSVYFGGGTPTAVPVAALEEILGLVNVYFGAANCGEFTVEAGRPETLSEGMLRMLREAGVNRISINPQSMWAPTLEKIGRGHTPEQIVQAVIAARREGIPVLNMDIILGLPGEHLAQVRYTLDKIGELAPDNLTVHSLAMKRAANWRQEFASLELAQEEAFAMAELAAETAQAWGMRPYYLYRQRHILGDLENVGYARPGTESIYNIQMMEERESVIGLGGGAITKCIGPDYRFQRLANPKCPATYSQQIDQIISEKTAQIRHILSV